MGKSSVNELEVDYKKLFESFPGLYLVLTSDFIISDASVEYLTINNTTKKQLVGKSIFSILNELPFDLKESILSLSSSLKKVLQNKLSDSITVRCPGSSDYSNDIYKSKLWKISNYPIISNQGEVTHILHQLEEIPHSLYYENINGQSHELSTVTKLENEILTDNSENTKQVKILLVDDREDNLFSLQEILSQPNYSFKRAKSGIEALKILLNEFDFTLIIMDVQMPIINGIETASLIYEREKLKHIPIIFITAAEYSEYLLFQGYKTGGVDYIYKPINSQLLKAKVAVFVELFKKNHLLLAQEQRLRNASELLQRKNNLLKNSNSELEAFTYSVSHDLRAPLRAIDGYSKILVEDYSKTMDSNAIDNLNQITSNARKMSHLIDDLLRLSMISRKELKKKSVNTASLINSILIDFKNQLRGRAIDFIIKPIEFSMADENLIRQVWVNLISNAIKYTQTKDNIKIEIGSKPGDNEIMFFIRDNGIGFDMKYIDKVFAVFQRLHSEKNFEGTGVGLALVKRIIQKHGGKIWADSVVNEGTTFYFTLPTI